jgi:hypothetical protein
MGWCLRSCSCTLMKQPVSGRVATPMHRDKVLAELLCIAVTLRAGRATMGPQAVAVAMVSSHASPRCRPETRHDAASLRHQSTSECVSD